MTASRAAGVDADADAATSSESPAMRPRIMSAGIACPGLFQRAISTSGTSASRRSCPRSLGSRRSDSRKRARLALFRSVHTGELRSATKSLVQNRSLRPRRWSRGGENGERSHGIVADVRVGIAHRLCEIADDPILVRHIRHDLRCQRPLAGIRGLAQNQAQLWKVPRGVTDEALLDNARRRIVKERVPLGVVFLGIAALNRCHHGGVEVLAVLDDVCGQPRASCGRRAKRRDGAALFLYPHIDGCTPVFAAGEVQVGSDDARYRREATFGGCQKRRPLVSIERDLVPLLERQRLTDLALGHSAQTIEVDDPDRELLAGRLLRNPQHRQDKRHDSTTLLIADCHRSLPTYPRGFAPRTPLHAPPRAASPARSGRVARSHRSLALLNERQAYQMASSVTAWAQWLPRPPPTSQRVRRQSRRGPSTGRSIPATAGARHTP